MKKNSAFRSFLIIGAALFPSVNSEYGTWFEAQSKCANRTKRLPTELSSSEWKGNTYWMGYSKRKSKWTQLLGCYPASKVSGADKTESMSIPSVGMCQEICVSYSTFAVKITTCICLQSFPSADQDRLTIEHCNKSCGDIPSQPFTQQCGGEDAYNVYRSIESMGFKIEGDGMCLSILCAGSSKVYGVYSCTKVLYAACEKAHEEIQWKDWTSSMKYCVTQLSSYLLGGDLLLTNATSDCTKIMNVSKSPSAENWIAGARQIYISIDQGYLTMNGVDFTACKQCRKHNCSYVPCSTHNEFICSDEVDSSTSTHSVSSKTELSLTPTTSADTESKTSITTTSDKSTSRYHSTSSNVEITTPMSGSVDKNVSAFTTTADADAVIFTHHSSSFEISTPVSGSVDKTVSDKKEIVAAIVTPIVVLFGAVIVFGVIYFRRCKGNATSETARSKQIEAKNLESTQYTYVDSSNNNAYFVLEPGSHISELDDTTKAESESPYNDLPEGEYDLLRDKDSRRKVSDDTYATSAKPSDYSDYDVTNRNRQTEEDSTYDHAGSNTTSLYGYGSVQHQEQDENAYSTSEY